MNNDAAAIPPKVEDPAASPPKTADPKAKVVRGSSSKTKTTPASEKELEDLEHFSKGWLGQVAGAPKNAPTNIAFLTILLSFVVGLISFLHPKTLEIWTFLVPIITGTIGYVFGKGAK